MRLVGLRLDKIEKANDSGHADVAEREVAALRQQIAALPQRIGDHQGGRWPPWRGWTTKTSGSASTHERLEFLRNEIKPLFRTVSEVDFKAMRFERDVLEYSLAVLNEDKEQAEALKEGIVEQISELPLSVSFVRQEESLIRAAQTNHYWAKATEDALRRSGRQARPADEVPRTARGQGKRSSTCR